MQTEELAQYIRRDCLEISGIAPNEELACEGVVRPVGNAIDVSVSDMDISVSHLIPSFNTTALPKIIVKFTRREIRDRFYYNRKNSRSLRGNRSRTSRVLHWFDGQGRVYQKLPLISTTLNVIFPQLFLTSYFANAGPSSREDWFWLKCTVAQKGHTCKLKMLLRTKNFTCKLKIGHAN